MPVNLFVVIASFSLKAHTLFHIQCCKDRTASIILQIFVKEPKLKNGNNLTIIGTVFVIRFLLQPEHKCSHSGAGP